MKRPKLTTVIGSDYQTRSGHRATCVCFCAPQDGKLRTYAAVSLETDSEPEFRSVAVLTHSRAALIRLASIWQRRAIPHQFTV